MSLSDSPDSAYEIVPTALGFYATFPILLSVQIFGLCYLNWLAHNEQIVLRRVGPLVLLILECWSVFKKRTVVIYFNLL